MADNPAIPSLQLGDLQATGVSSQRGPDGTQALRIGRVEARELTLQTPVGLVRAARAVLSDVAVRVGAGFTARELRLESASIELQALPRRGADGPRKTWRLEPLAALDGNVQADITDAAWIFDAKVTISIDRGRIDFNRATVEHIGPDSSMGLDRTGIYVDAPNGRSYLYLLPATNVPGTHVEQRGTLLSAWSGDRGAIDLEPLVAGLLSGAAIGAPAAGTGQMLARTRMNAELRLGNGVIGDARQRVMLTGREEGKNRIELSSAPSGAGFVLRMPELSAGESHVELFGKIVSSGALAAGLSVQRRDLAPRSAAIASIAELTLTDLVVSDAQRS